MSKIEEKVKSCNQDLDVYRAIQNQILVHLLKDVVDCIIMSYLGLSPIYDGVFYAYETFLKMELDQDLLDKSTLNFVLAQQKVETELKDTKKYHDWTYQQIHQNVDSSLKNIVNTDSKNFPSLRCLEVLLGGFDGLSGSELLFIVQSFLNDCPNLCTLAFKSVKHVYGLSWVQELDFSKSKNLKCISLPEKLYHMWNDCCNFPDLDEIHIDGVVFHSPMLLTLQNEKTKTKICHSDYLKFKSICLTERILANYQLPNLTSLLLQTDIDPHFNFLNKTLRELSISCQKESLSNSLVFILPNLKSLIIDNVDGSSKRKQSLIMMLDLLELHLPKALKLATLEFKNISPCCDSWKIWLDRMQQKSFRPQIMFLTIECNDIIYYEMNFLEVKEFLSFIEFFNPTYLYIANVRFLFKSDFEYFITFLQKSKIQTINGNCSVVQKDLQGCENILSNSRFHADYFSVSLHTSLTNDDDFYVV
jgi:hypothetical protein